MPGQILQPWGNGLRLSGCLLLGAGLSLVPANSFPAKDRLAQQIVVLAAKPRMAEPREPSPVPADALPRPHAAPAPRLAAAPSPATVVAFVPEPGPPVLAVTPSLPEPSFVAPPVLPRQEAFAAPPEPAGRGGAVFSASRKVDIAQVADDAPPLLHVPQLREPGLVAGAPPTLAAKVDAMQVPLGAPPLLAGDERAALLAEAPSEMTVRMGRQAIGRVAFRTTETGMIDVQLSGLLDLVADRMVPEEYTRLRNSAAASSFVPLDQLRAIGLSLRYDAVYDELEISA